MLAELDAEVLVEPGFEVEVELLDCDIVVLVEVDTLALVEPDRLTEVDERLAKLSLVDSEADWLTD